MLMNHPGKPAGILPAQVTLTEGEHTFTVTGAADEVTLVQKVVLKDGGASTTMLHLGQ